MATKSGENPNFTPFAQDTLVLPYGSKIRSKLLYLLRFLRYSHFFIFHKNPRWPPKVAKFEILPLFTGHSCTTLWVKNSLEIALSVTVFEVFTLFHLPQKSKMATKSGKNPNFTPMHRTLYTTLWVKTSLEIALSLTVFEIFTLFHFQQKSKMAAKNRNFTPLHRTLFYDSVGKKFARNRSISYGFGDIHTFHFLQKSKMAVKSGEN